MKKLFIALMIFPSCIFGQDIGSIASKMGSYNGLSSRSVEINLNSEKVGHPYMFDNWKEGYLVINDSVFSYQKNMQFDQEQGELILKARVNNQGVIITDEKVTGFSIKNQMKNRNFIKLNSEYFEDFEEFSERKFFEIISNFENTNFLIKDTQKYLFDPNRSKGYVTVNNLPKVYKTKTVYFIKNKNGKYVQTKLNKNKILKILNDKKDLVNKFIKTNKLKLSEEFDVVKLLNYYYNLG